ncbi:hypothetical protein [Paenibacillus turpanensis]|uniref:hypothetical protein n=1 Tax=Paenibacillus turpanensis TaxID=2689078 RepID=UPI00140E0240|nr:hypothetical protein [Paenibacillus turpanensis]
MTESRMKRFTAVWAVWLAALLLLSACGGPKADVSIFLMPENGVSIEAAEKLKTALHEIVGESPTVELRTTPVFAPEKLAVEIASAENGIIIVGREIFDAFAKQGGYVLLEDIANPADYPSGVVEVPDRNDQLVKGLFGIPMNGSVWFNRLNYKGPELYAFIPQNAPDIEKAKQVLKRLMEK